MERVSIKLVYNRRNRFLSDGTANISIEVYKGGSGKFRKYIPTKVFVKKDQWNEKLKKVVNHHLDFRLNKMLNDDVRKIEEYEYKLRNQGQELTLGSLEELLVNDEVGSESFLAFWRSEISDYTKKGTKKSHASAYNLLEKFRSDIRFSEINYSLITDFDKFLRKNGLAQNTIAKYHQHLKKFINLAKKKKKFAEENPYSDFKIVKVEGDRENLTHKQVSAIENLVIPERNKELIVIKDTFLLSCYTGLRFVDVFSLCKKDIVENKDGLTIVKRMEKVDKIVTLPLSVLFNGRPEAIIRKYINSENDLLFPQVSNQHVNRLLKSLAIAASIEARLTFHVARHTFGTFLAEITQNPYLIMDLMGHSKIDTSMIYIHRSQERINKQLRECNWIF